MIRGHDNPVLSLKTPDFQTPLFSCLEKPPFFATAPFSHQTTRSDFIEGFGVLTTARVRDIGFRYHGALRALIMGMGQNCLKTLLISPYQGKMACESMVRLQTMWTWRIP
jgi:hypothetical protein